MWVVGVECERGDEAAARRGVPEEAGGYLVRYKRGEGGTSVNSGHPTDRPTPLATTSYTPPTLPASCPCLTLLSHFPAEGSVADLLLKHPRIFEYIGAEGHPYLSKGKARIQVRGGHVCRSCARASHPHAFFTSLIPAFPPWRISE